ncbi:MAG: hypothetical protein Tp156SUR915002_14 [Prokaryotic dsDNA virus sp.]|jgi:GNAT superfamily N-acetyltransferase|nr:MAG: hypothetical protein Tp162SUR384061_23 [Prokaryotic dsDNA virus sp.]QDP59753.1 MAG: hypothetical protein Tp156SUR915002_14 [Prokaryotic dsDNA virus sp.]|tara:strand:- start:23976 stop:24464 length:489 start_codon:yes stop_codon:yes gene_type:complete
MLLNKKVSRSEIQALKIHIKDWEYKGSKSTMHHLKSALYDWDREKQWNKDSAKVFGLNKKCYAFISYTKRDPRHCTLRHFFTLETARGEGLGSLMISIIFKDMQENNVKYFRFFANKPAIKFYEKLGFTWHGLSKTGLPFCYWDIDKQQSAELPKAQQRYIV